MNRVPGLRLYALLFRLYPRAFRQEYAAGMIEMFALRGREAQRTKTIVPHTWFLARELSAITGGAMRQHLAAWWARRHQRPRPSRPRSPWLSPWARDFRFAGRRLLTQPGFTAATVMTLALGIGANTAIFSLVYGVVLRPLPFPDSERIVQIQHYAAEFPVLNLSRGTYYHYLQRNETLESIGLYRRVAYNLTEHGAPDRVIAALATASMFSVLRATPRLGRTLLPADEAPGATPVAVLSHALWSTRFGGDRAALGASIRLDGVSHEIIGVMPRSFVFPTPDVALWVALDIDPNNLVFRLSGLPAIARPQPGVSFETAERDLNRTVADFPETFPGLRPEMLTNLGLGVRVTPLKDTMVRDVRQTLWILMGTVGFVLLIACANVAGLFLVRAEGRQKELAIRTALGAGRAQLTRYFLAESLTLAGIGGMAGLGLAVTGLKGVIAFGPSNIPRLHEVHPDLTVVAFTAAVSVLAAVIFGVMPMARARYAAFDALKESGRGGGTGRHRVRAQNSLVITQIALALVLLVGSGLMVRSFWQLRNVDPGFDPTNVLTLRVALPSAKYPDEMDAAVARQALVERIEALPGAVTVGAVDCLPLMGCTDTNLMEAEDFPLAPDELPPRMAFSTVSPGYFETLQIPLLAGRLFERRDHEEQTNAMLVSQAVSERFWPGQNPVGKRAYPGLRGNAHWFTIVGIVANIRHDALNDEQDEIIYLPMASSDSRGYAEQRAMAFVVRTAGAPLAIVERVRRVIAEFDPDLPVAAVQSMDEVVARSTIRVEFTMLLLGIAAVVALCLGAVGIYGVVSYVVSRRTGEIGLRLALGARAADVRWMVLRQGGRVAVAGLLLGLAGAFGLTRLMTALLFEVSPTDPLTYAGVSVVLLGVTFLATDLPARRAARGDPAAALKAE